MFACPRCATRYSAGAVSPDLICPRCRAKDGVYAPLTFWLFDRLPPEMQGKRGHAHEGRERRPRADSGADQPQP